MHHENGNDKNERPSKTVVRQARKHVESDKEEEEEEEDSENEGPENLPHRLGSKKRKTDVDMSWIWEDRELGADGLWHKVIPAQPKERDSNEWHRERSENRAGRTTFKAPSKKRRFDNKEEENETQEYKRADLDSNYSRLQKNLQ